MILMLDAHALLWWLARDRRLQPSASTAVADPANDVLVSAATIWEIEIKRALGKLEAPADLIAAVEASGFDSLPITDYDAQRAGRLPMHHRDPFDRMLVAQATRLEATVISRDPAFDAYGIERLVA
jgi:PIN domain nuclease of toxin-antitoxin system